MRPLNEAYIIRIKSYIEKYFSENGGSPTVREVSDGTGIKLSTVQYYLAKMRDSGEIRYSGRRGLSTDFTEKLSCSNATVVAPLIGEVACGSPILAEENIEQYFRLPSSLVGSGEFFLLRARGQSMIEAGIDDGDLVLVRRQERAGAGDIVVALLGDEATLKRYYPEGGGVRLHPENKEMKDIIVSGDIIIQGVATKVLKDL